MCKPMVIFLVLFLCSKLYANEELYIETQNKLYSLFEEIVPVMAIHLTGQGLRINYALTYSNFFSEITTDSVYIAYLL